MTLLVVGVACGDGAPDPSPTAGSPTASPTPATAPLTGEELDDPDVADRPVVAVKIENSEAARPQAGLDAADLVFEELTEGGVTRFLAVYHSRVPELVGPVRSGRPEDASLLPAFDALLFLSGARPDVLEDLRAAGVAFREEDGEVLFRDPDRQAPHNVFARGADLFATAEGQVPPAEPIGWRFAEEPPDGQVPCPDPCEDDPGAGILVEMSPQAVAGFAYDAEQARYRREQDGVPQTVAGSGRVGAANVLVLATEVRQEGCCDPAGNPLTVTETVGEGRAVVLRDGRRYEGRWSKAAPGAHVQVEGPDGRPFAFRPGATWVLLAPESGVPTVAASPGAG